MVFDGSCSWRFLRTEKQALKAPQWEVLVVKAFWWIFAGQGKHEQKLRSPQGFFFFIRSHANQQNLTLLPVVSGSSLAFGS